MTLAEIKPGESCKIITLKNKSLLRKRLIDMGLTTGTTVTVRKLAPLGDPMEIYLRGYKLTLRKNEANQIIVEKIKAKY